MKEKISSSIYKKLCEGFRTQFIPRPEFETKFSEHYNLFLEKLISLTKEYYQLKNSKSKDENSQIVKIYKDDFILQQLNNEYLHYYHTKNKYTIADLNELKTSKENTYEKYASNYNYKFDNENEVVISPLDFVRDKIAEIVLSEKSNPDLSFTKLFWTFTNSLFSSKEWEYRISKTELVETPEKIIEKFKMKYLSETSLQLLDISDKQISDLSFSGFETYIVNVGERKDERERSGWITSNFTVFNNGKTFSYTSSFKDAKLINGKFVNIFILQLNKKHLLKISVTLDETEQTPYIISKEFEKVSFKNECEISISKHHGNETIIFDTKKEALEFQAKVLEIKEGRYNNNYNNRR
jgi:hypothetical protein